MRGHGIRSRAGGAWLLAFLAATILGGCGGKDDRAGGGANSGVTLRVVAGSENKELEPIVAEFAQRQGATIEVTYQGSVDMSLALAQGAAVAFDAVWPANSLWIVMGDRQKVVKYERSIMRSPVVFGVKRSVARQLGWTGGATVRVADILVAAESGHLRFAMTSASQSNSGASAYLGFLHALAGNPEVLSATHLADGDVRAKVKRLLAAVDRSSGSSGWLKDMFLATYPRFDAMVNYEAMIIEANQALVARGDEPLYAIYPADGLTIADHPLAYVNKGDPAKEALFLALQEHLLSPEIQARIQALGRRTGLIGIDMGRADPAVFNPDWGIDVARVISPVPVPDEQVIAAALELYQTILRKPSLTVYALDFSGSMEGEGQAQVKEAMTTLLRSDVARRYLLQSSADDVHVVIPFNSEPLAVWEARGNDPAQLDGLLQKVLALDAGGGTNIYAAAQAAFDALAPFEVRLADYFPAIILLTDGKSKGSKESLVEKLDQLAFGRDVPIFSITFGDAEESQLQALSELTSGRVFDGRADLVRAFRHAKGYN